MEPKSSHASVRLCWRDIGWYGRAPRVTLILRIVSCDRRIETLHPRGFRLMRCYGSRGFGGEESLMLESLRNENEVSIVEDKQATMRRYKDAKRGPQLVHVEDVERSICSGHLAFQKPSSRKASLCQEGALPRSGRTTEHWCKWLCTEGPITTAIRLYNR
jgi:hypothetical protein